MQLQEPPDGRSPGHQGSLWDNRSRNRGSLTSPNLEVSPLVSPGEKGLSLSIRLTKTPSVFLLVHNVSREKVTLDRELCMLIHNIKGV